jgi:nucleoside-diphosphate-sugar epimerase
MWARVIAWCARLGFAWARRRQSGRHLRAGARGRLLVVHRARQAPDERHAWLSELYFGIVDVRDVADLHLRAMTHPAAKGERFIAVSGNAMSMREIATVLKARLGDAAKNVPTRQLPNWVVRLGAQFDPAMRQLTPMLGKIRHATSAKAERMLGWKPRSREDAIVATAESLLKFGIAT